LLPFFLFMREALVKHFEKFVTEKRNMLFDSVLEQRTTYITVVLEDIFQSHNASAVLRSCDCFGIQDVHIIENRNRFSVNSEIALGSEKWLSVNKFSGTDNNTELAIRNLHERGYRIVATSPHRGDTKLIDFDLSKGKVALFIGTEMEGLSEHVLQEADEFLTIPMYGFTESFNLSVTAAIILHTLTEKLRVSNINWRLTTTEMMELKLSWLKTSIKNSDLIESQFLKTQKE
jgi:tRNA (guanosine-2'-O-)-methyltransferase